MAEQIKFGDRLFLRGEKVLFDNGANDAVIESRNGTLIIKGNLTVQGTTTTANAETVTFSDSYILLNGDHTGPATDDVGIEINRGDDPNVLLTWDETADRWSFEDKDVFTSGSITAASLSGDGSNLTDILLNYTTDDLAEGVVNLYYTDTRVGDYLTANEYVTKDYVDNSHPVQTYTNATPMPVAVGGYDAGTTFDTVSLQDMFTGLLYPYQDPAFTAFAISGQSTTLEVGESIPAGTYTFTWSTSNSSNIVADSIVIEDITNSITLGSSLTNDGTELLTLAAEVVKTSATNNTWQISATDTQTATFTRNFTVSWRWRTFYGTSPDAVLNEAGVESLLNTTLSSNFTGNKTFAGGDYKWMAYPTSFGLKTSFIDQATGFGVAMEPAYTLSLTNAYGATTDYYVHRTTYTIVGAITIGVS